MFVWTFTNDIRYVTKSGGKTHFPRFSEEQVNDCGATKKERKEKPTREKFTKMFIIVLLVDFLYQQNTATANTFVTSKLFAETKLIDAWSYKIK